MRIVVDTNIVFSAMLNTNSKIARVILQPKTRLNFYSTETLLLEIEEHSEKLRNISGYTESEFKRIFEIFTRKIRFINVQLIPKEIYLKSLSLTENVDVDDTEFVALTNILKENYGVATRNYEKDWQIKIGINLYPLQNFMRFREKKRCKTPFLIWD